MVGNEVVDHNPQDEAIKGYTLINVATISTYDINSGMIIRVIRGFGDIHFFFPKSLSEVKLIFFLNLRPSKDSV